MLFYFGNGPMQPENQRKLMSIFYCITKSQWFQFNKSLKHFYNLIIIIDLKPAKSSKKSNIIYKLEKAELKLH